MTDYAQELRNARRRRNEERSAARSRELITLDQPAWRWVLAEHGTRDAVNSEERGIVRQLLGRTLRSAQLRSDRTTCRLDLDDCELWLAPRTSSCGHAWIELVDLVPGEIIDVSWFAMQTVPLNGSLAPPQRRGMRDVVQHHAGLVLTTTSGEGVIDYRVQVDHDCARTSAVLRSTHFSAAEQQLSSRAWEAWDADQSGSQP